MIHWAGRNDHRDDPTESSGGRRSEERACPTRSGRRASADTRRIPSLWRRARTGSLVHWYTGGILYCRQSNESLYYGFSLEYAIHVVNGDGRGHFSLFQSRESPRPITSEERDATREKGELCLVRRGEIPRTADLGMPDHRPFFSRFLSDDKGRLYVVRFHPITAKDHPSSDIDVFSKGRHLSLSNDVAVYSPGHQRRLPIRVPAG